MTFDLNHTRYGDFQSDPSVAKQTDLLTASFQETLRFSSAVGSIPGTEDVARSCQESVEQAIDLLDCDDFGLDDFRIDDDNDSLDVASDSLNQLRLRELRFDNCQRMQEAVISLHFGNMEIHDDDDSSCSSDESESFTFEDQIIDELDYMSLRDHERSISRRSDVRNLPLEEQRRKKELLMDNMDYLQRLVAKQFSSTTEDSESDLDDDDDIETSSMSSESDYEDFGYDTVYNME
eukprot:scaffold25695_cov108-Cylindrotheca_fusiformis.AAC.2